MAPKFEKLFLIFCVVVLIFSGLSRGRPLGSDLISDAIKNGGEGGRAEQLLRMVAPAAEEEVCDQSYGFLPCTTTALGNLFLILVYGYLMFLAATYLSTGSELLLEILGPGLVGGLFLPMLGALPDAILILGT